MKQKAAPKPRVKISALRQEIAELRTVGAQMSNVCFNLQQRQTSDPHERQLMRSLRQEWDRIERAEKR